MAPSVHDPPALRLVPRDPLARELEQIQLNPGHASLMTTEQYLGTALDSEAAPCDVLGPG
jgi:hypothetical protein